MLEQLTRDYQIALDWTWEQWQPHYQTLLDAELTADTLDEWLLAQTQLSNLMQEVGTRLRIATDVNTEDEEAEARYKRFVAEVRPNVQQAAFNLNKMLLDSGLETDAIRIPLRNVRNAVEIFSPDNLPLFTQVSDLTTEYNKLAGSQTVTWEDEERTLSQMRPLLREADRDVREKAWRSIQERVIVDRASYNDLWQRYMTVRKQIYQNAGLNDFREYAWKSRQRHDYTPENVLEFCNAIETVVVPILAKLRETRRQQMGLDTLRPWDTDVDILGRPAIKPYETIEDFSTTATDIFQQLDPQLGDYFEAMRTSKMLDLDNRKGKAPGGYNTSLPVTESPFIFMNAVGLENDVRTLLHEAGHAFHNFERYANLQYAMQRRSPMEFNEVASMAMELLALPYVTEDKGGYFSEEEAARYIYNQLSGIMMGLAHMATVALFQHWIYTHHDEATDATACDAQWLDLRERFLPGVDWSGLEDFRINRWRRQLHIFVVPFYYIEYALARLGSLQVWKNALNDPATALTDYREALALGGTVNLPELYATAGAKLAFDVATLQDAITLVKQEMERLEPLAMPQS